jgi:hypothetical protein
MHHEHVDLVAAGDAILDIGGDIGALILYTDQDLLGHEIEVSREGEDEGRTHTAIRARGGPDHPTYAGIYPALSQGTYRIWTAAPDVQTRVVIVGGQVSEVDWRRSGR